MVSRLESSIHSHLQMEKKKAELVRKMCSRVRWLLNVWGIFTFLGATAEGA